MIKALTGKDIPESQLRDEMKQIMNKPNHDFNKSGIKPTYAVRLLKMHGVDSYVKRGVAASDLGKLSAKGKPIMVGFKNPYHRVILDSVGKDSKGNSVYYVRDPSPEYRGKVRNMTEADFGSSYNDTTIIIIPR